MTAAQAAGIAAAPVNMAIPQFLRTLEQELRWIASIALTVDGGISELIAQNGVGAANLRETLQNADLVCQSLAGLADFCAGLSMAAAPLDEAFLDATFSLESLKLGGQRERLSGRDNVQPACSDPEIWSD